MTSIANLPTLTPAVTASKTPSAQQDFKETNPAAGSGDTPATIVSLSTAAAAASTPSQNLPTLDPDKVSNALSEVSGVNGIAWLNAHLDVSLYRAKFGDEAADGLVRGSYEDAYRFAGVAGAAAIDAGISVQSSIRSVDDLKAYTASGSSAPVITVADFSFKSGGSVYSVTNQPDGSLLGTKDGHAWQTWQLTAVNGKTNFGNSSSNAAAALETLTSLNDHKASSKTLAPLDVSA